MSRYFESEAVAAEFAERVRSNQHKLISDLKSDYEFIVCGSGSAGSVVARRLAENPEFRVLLLEAGGTDETEVIMNPNRWPMTLGTELDWGFVAEPNPRLNGRAIPYSMGKVLGGGSSINVSTWSRGHRVDWDFYASDQAIPRWPRPKVTRRRSWLTQSAAPSRQGSRMSARQPGMCFRLRSGTCAVI